MCAQNKPSSVAVDKISSVTLWSQAASLLVADLDSMDAVQPDQHDQCRYCSSTRKKLATAGQEQLVQLLKTSKALLDAYSNIQSTTESQQRLQQLQQHYLHVSQDVRQTLQQCQALEQQEAAFQAAAATAGASATEEQQIQQLQAQAAALQQQLQRANQLVKQVIDKLRHMLDAFNMWDSHERRLVQNSVQFAVTGPTGLM